MFLIPVALASCSGTTKDPGKFEGLSPLTKKYWVAFYSTFSICPFGFSCGVTGSGPQYLTWS